MQRNKKAGVAAGEVTQAPHVLPNGGTCAAIAGKDFVVLGIGTESNLEQMRQRTVKLGPTTMLAFGGEFAKVVKFQPNFIGDLKARNPSGELSSASFFNIMDLIVFRQGIAPTVFACIDKDRRASCAFIDMNGSIFAGNHYAVGFAANKMRGMLNELVNFVPGGIRTEDKAISIISTCFQRTFNPDTNGQNVLLYLIKATGINEFLLTLNMQTQTQI